jgi:hypothetical protein
MSNPTTPFNWQMPTNTDLVTDLPADFEVFGQAVATSMADLLGGTSGQILSKATNADMDFAWINNDQGDITGITATSPLTGGGTSGAITVGIQASSTTQSGAVQLTDSTSSTSTTTAATPNSVKSSYDLANAAIPKSTGTTAGDLLYYTGSSTPTRLGIGTAGQVLTVNGGATAPSWAAPAGGGKVLQVVSGTYSTNTTISSTTFTDSGLTATITPSSSSSRILVMVIQACTTGASDRSGFSSFRLMRGASVAWTGQGSSSTSYGVLDGSSSDYAGLRMYFTLNYLDSPATTSATTYKTQGRLENTTASAVMDMNFEGITSQIILMEIGA